MHSHDISLFFMKKKRNKVMPALLFGLVLPLNATWADQQSSTSPQNSNIVIERNPNQAPEVDAGDDQTVLEPAHNLFHY